MPKGIPNKRYTGEFKQMVVETMIREKLSYIETRKRFDIAGEDRVRSWERIYLTEGPEGLYVERRGRASTGRPRKLPKETEENLLLEIAQLPRATFYYHLKTQSREDKYTAAKEEITAIYHEHKGRYGYRRITTELNKRGIFLNHSQSSFWFVWFHTSMSPGSLAEEAQALL